MKEGLDKSTTLRRLRLLTGCVICGLTLSGATALPLQHEVAWLVDVFPETGQVGGWLRSIQQGLDVTAEEFPFLFYGTDWLAFGHFVIAIAFIGALRDPVRNRWLFDFGLIACALVIPYALVFGWVRGIPFWWRWIDCSFGVLGFIPFWFCRKWALKLESTAACAKDDGRNMQTV